MPAPLIFPQPSEEARSFLNNHPIVQVAPCVGCGTVASMAMYFSKLGGLSLRTAVLASIIAYGLVASIAIALTAILLPALAGAPNLSSLKQIFYRGAFICAVIGALIFVADPPTTPRWIIVAVIAPILGTVMMSFGHLWLAKAVREAFWHGGDNSP